MRSSIDGIFLESCSIIQHKSIQVVPEVIGLENHLIRKVVALRNFGSSLHWQLLPLIRTVMMLTSNVHKTADEKISTC